MIRITEKAREKLIDILNEESATLVRFGLQGGGCNGFSYFFTIEQEDAEDDLEFEIDPRRKIVVDSMSNMYLEDAEIDYKRDLMGESFVFNNPNQTSSCGCGSSVAF